MLRRNTHEVMRVSMPKHVEDVVKDSTPLVLAVQLPSLGRTNDVPAAIYERKMTRRPCDYKIP